MNNVDWKTELEKKRERLNTVAVTASSLDLHRVLLC